MRKKNLYSFGEMTIDWLRSKPELAESSRTAYTGEINRLAEHFAHIGIRSASAVCREDWWGYLSSIQEKRIFVDSKRREELQAGSIHQARRITRDFFMWALEEGIINWLPRLPDSVLENTESRSRPKERIGIDAEVARILTGSAEPEDMAEYRAHLTFNLVFWGTLKPIALAALKVRDFSDAGFLAISHLSPQRQIEVPSHVVDLWRRYRAVRRNVSGSLLHEAAPLISRLDAELPLTAWGIWSVFNEWQNKYLPPDGGRMTPRDLRMAYLDFLCSDGELRLKLACTHGGVRTKRVEAWNGDIPNGMIATVNGQIRTYLQSHID